MGSFNIGSVKIGLDAPLFVMAGPCAIETEAECIDIAKRLVEISEETGINEETISDILNISYNVVSLDSELAFESGNLLDIFEDNSFNPDKELMDKCIQEETMKFLEHLLEKEKKILLYRFSFYGGKKYTLKKIGEELGISAETVRQIEIRAIKKLREHADELKEYVYN